MKTIHEILLDKDARIKLCLVGLTCSFFFHLVFRPFQMSQYDTYDFIFVNTAYLIISIVIVSFHLIFFPKYFKEKFLFFVSTRHYRRLFLIWIIVFLGFSFFIFKILFGYYSLTIDRIITGLSAVIAMTAFPLLLLTFHDRKSEITINRETVKIDITQEEIRIDELLYVFSDKNYVVWVYLSKNEIRNKKIRGTIKSTFEKLSIHSSIVQTHRAYLVNIAHVAEICKEHSSHSLKIKNHTVQVPLSRSFYSSFQKAFLP